MKGLNPMEEGLARAHINIALVKYWGKRDPRLNLPMNGSISVTLDHYFVTASVAMEPRRQEDRLWVNGAQASPQETQRVSKFFQRLKEYAGVSGGIVARTTANVPMASGLASSSAVFAALTKAFSLSLGLPWSSSELSRLARLGSGSASRSIHGGFVEWVKGIRNDGEDSYAVPLATMDSWPSLAFVVVQVAAGPKAVSSREGMQRVVQTSPLYPGWLASVDHDLTRVRDAIYRQDLSLLGSVAESNALKMHATALAAVPPLVYWTGATVSVIRRVQEMRAAGIEAYVTIDAGPHPVVLVEHHQAADLAYALSTIPDVVEVVTTQPGPGVEAVSAI
ncbi:diphosphomevalonate decarboxylase [Sulfobacillus harzensis]|uniref:diphosphomevalonate decarboxylase n=1 Tax=Sulfobacillus harzensis TaxID=2729629 RepID=A0A7Y0L5I3_9FIRM|nr:diphosphomevalonate decarboxylase [Sulfobacillus harzensis]NMP23682.1 diphosphomevalonate decarboxylase [Sulfobacillus harzensis]